MASTKKRFGVSVSSTVAEDIDMLAKILKVERSTVVEEALREYLDDHRHLLIPNECAGVITAVCPDNIGVASIVREFKSIIVGHFHLHLHGMCLDVLTVHGESRKIGELLGRLKKIGCRARYLPVKETRE